ncbi:hypothetical protein N9L49_02510 [Rhodospirillales bacterium]|nr:hypothetical protein [Rhodospirillales bacterium]
MAIAAKKQSWLDFEKWCVLRGLSPAPANPWTLCAYIRVIEKTKTPVALKRHIGQIGMMHFEKLRKRPDRDPKVKLMLEIVQEQADAAKENKAVPVLFDADDFLDADKPKPKKKPAKKTDKKRGLSTEPKLVRRKKI